MRLFAIFLAALFSSALAGPAAVAEALPGSAAPAVLLLNEYHCREYATWSRDFVWARDVGADKERVRAWVHSLNLEGWTVSVLMLRDLDRLWRTRAHPQLVYELVLQDCHRRNGRYEEES